MKGHGRVEFLWNNNLLSLKGFGPFNEEGVKDVSEQYLRVIQNREHDAFTIIEIWDDECLGSPDAFKNVSTTWDILEDNNCLAIAVVVSNSIQRSMCRKLLPSIGKVFFNENDAKQWIKEQSTH